MVELPASPLLQRDLHLNGGGKHSLLRKGWWGKTIYLPTSYSHITFIYQFNFSSSQNYSNLITLLVCKEFAVR